MILDGVLADPTLIGLGTNGPSGITSLDSEARASEMTHSAKRWRLSRLCVSLLEVAGSRAEVRAPNIK